MNKVKYTVKCLLCGEKFIDKVALVTHSVFKHNWSVKYKNLTQKEEE